MKSLKFAFFFLAIFAMVTFGQTFTPDANGRVNPLTTEIRSLMEHADKVITQTTNDRRTADQNVVTAKRKLEATIADTNTTSTHILLERIAYITAISKAQEARLPADKAVNKAAMAYFDNVIKVVKAGHKLSPDDYGNWQSKTLPLISPPGPPEQDLMEKADAAQKVADAKERKEFRKMQSDFSEMQKKNKELFDRAK